MIRMKRFVMAVLALALLASAIAAPALASQYVTGTGGDSHVRSGPGLGYSAVGMLYEGDSLTYLGSTNWDSRGVAWYNVSLGGYGSAWVSSKYTSLSGSDLGGDYYGPCVEATGRANVRSGPGTDYESMGTIFSGERLEYLGTSSKDSGGATWYKVRYYSFGTGWVSSKVGKIVTGTPGASENPGASKKGDSIRATGRLNVRSGPGLGYSDLGTIEKGGSAPYLGNSSVDERNVTWYQISYGSGFGWVSSRYCEMVGSGASSDWWWDEEDSDGFIEATGRLNVRSGPGLDYSDLGTIEKGDTAPYLGNSSVDARGVTWYQISYGSGSGWVSSRYSRLYD